MKHCVGKLWHLSATDRRLMANALEQAARAKKEGTHRDRRTARSYEQMAEKLRGTN